jgi:hypothetical protein
MPHVVFEQEIDMSLLDLLTLRHVREIADPAVQSQSYRRENVFVTPSRRDGLSGKFLRGLRSHLLLEAANRGELGSEVGEHLPETGLGKLGDVDGAEAVAKIIEAVAPLADLRRDEPERIAVVADPPICALRWSVAHV